MWCCERGKRPGNRAYNGGMDRREFLSTTAAALALSQPAAAQPAQAKLGIDLFSIRSQGWTPFQYLDYCAKQRVQVVHFSEIRFIGSLEPENLRAVRRRAEELGIEVELGTGSTCPTSKAFNAREGTAEEQLTRMIDSAHIVGSKIVRTVLGTMDDRKPGPITRHMEAFAQVLRRMRSKAMDAGIHIAIENHAGDMQSHELKTLIEEAGPDFVGACLDSGNPLWTLEDPHVAFETLRPYVLTSHVRDSAVWRVPEGAAVAWVRMGEGNVDIASYVRKYVAGCPGRALSMETIVTGPRIFPYRDPAFWDAYRDIPAWEFERFAEIAERGSPRPAPPRAPDAEAARRREREDLEACLEYTRSVFAKG
jgi:3-oxoisoapionate decarboxylase